MTVGIITEASGKIGTGHLVESISLAEHLSQASLEAELWVNEGVPKSLMTGRLRASIHLYTHLAKDLNRIIKKMQSKGIRVVLFNLRNLDNEVLGFFNSHFRLVCIDELGRRRLDCDAIINPLLVPDYHKYWPGVHHSPVLFLGPDYFIVSEGISGAHGSVRIFSGGIKTVSICMGGVDRTGATFRIIDALAGWKDCVIKNVVLGCGCQYYKEIYDKLDTLSGKNFRLFQGVDSIEDFFLASDVVFSAGGNTLYELACTGTPALVLYEDEHEKENGLAFADRGFGYCLGLGTSCEPEFIWNRMDMLESAEMRQAHSNVGKALVDGGGVARIAELVRRLIDDLPIQALS